MRFCSLVLFAFFLVPGWIDAAPLGPTIVVKKDAHRIAGLSTNGITRWTSSLGSPEDEISAVNQSGNTAMVTLVNKKTGKTRIIQIDAAKGITRFSQSIN